MSHLVYGCRFDVPGEGAWDTIVRPRYERWMADRYSRAFKCAATVDLNTGAITGNLPARHSLGVRQYQANFVAVEMIWSFPGDRGLVWKNSMRAAQLEDRCALEHRVELSFDDYSVAPVFYSVGAPTVVRVVCQNNVLVGDMRVRATVYPLEITGVEQFLSLLISNERRLPVVLITPFANGEPGYLDARALADHLAGVAIVAEADTPATTRALSSLINRLGCYDGGVRIYWPGFDLADELRHHPLMLGSRIGVIGPDRAVKTIEGSIFSVAAFRFTPDPRIAAIIATSEAQARAERAQEAIGLGDTTWEQYALEMSEKLDDALVSLKSLENENANLKDNQKILFSFNSDEQDNDSDDEEVARSPDSVSQAVDYAVTDCPQLTFLDSSRSSALDSPFKRPCEVYEILVIMNKVAGVWAKNQGGGDLRQMLKDAGLGKRVSNFISQTSRGKWSDDYTFLHKGERVVFDWHVTLGAGAADTCASIHFLPEPPIGKIVIGHVGRHLTNTKS